MAVRCKPMCSVAKFFIDRSSLQPTSCIGIWLSNFMCSCGIHERLQKKSRKCKNSSCLIFDVHLSIFLFSWQVQRSRTHVHIGVQLGQLTHISNTIILYRQYRMLYTGCSGNPLQPIPRLHIAYISSCECTVTSWLAVAWTINCSPVLARDRLQKHESYFKNIIYLKNTLCQIIVRCQCKLNDFFYHLLLSLHKPIIVTVIARIIQYSG